MAIDEQKLKDLLDKPASDALNVIRGPKMDDLINKEEISEKKEEEVTTSEDTEEETPTGGKKMRIPASRWKTITSRLDAAEAKAAAADELRERLAILESEMRSRPETGAELPEWWIELYGDSDASKKGYSLQQRGMREAMAEAQQLARDNALREERERVEYQAQVEDSFDTQLEELEEVTGKAFTDRQAAELLEIVEKYSPTDSDGSFTAFISLEKAYELQQSLSKENPAKTRMAQIAGASSEGNTTTRPASTGPLDWGNWRNRFGG